MSRSSDTDVTVARGGFAGLLTVAFIVLKLTGVIDWSWWWVLAPVWIGALLALLFLAGIIILTLTLDR